MSQVTTETLLDTVQYTAFKFFWNEANPANGLIKDRSAANGGGGAPCSIASVGFGLTALCIGVDHGWVAREAARDRVFITLSTFWSGPQGTGQTGFTGYKGFFYHFLDMDTATRTWNSELSNIDSALLFAGILYAREYFDSTDQKETDIRALADSIFSRADWEWFRNFSPGLPMEWTPESGFRGLWTGYNEAMIMYILGYGSSTHPLQTGWSTWTSGYTWQTLYGYTYVPFPPLFGHQYSHCWIDFRNLADDYMRGRGIDYFENSRRATLAQQAYCAANPGRFTGYSDSLWGITASDGPEGYNARGAPPAFNDNGTITPTAAISSLPFAPDAVIPTIRHMWNAYGSQLWSQYGFRDAFNLTQNWWASDVIGIDQGPIIIMIENYRTGKVWERFMKNPDIKRGLERIGFSPLTNVPDKNLVPFSFRLHQNFPNPFNNATVISYEIPTNEHVELKVFDVIGQQVEKLVDEVKAPGTYSVRWQADRLSSGVYYYRLMSGFRVESKRLLFLK